MPLVIVILFFFALELLVHQRGFASAREPEYISVFWDLLRLPVTPHSEGLLASVGMRGEVQKQVKGEIFVQARLAFPSVPTKPTDQSFGKVLAIMLREAVRLAGLAPP